MQPSLSNQVACALRASLIAASTLASVIAAGSCAVNTDQAPGAEVTLGALASTVAIEDPPSYAGTVDDAGECSRSYATIGFKPAASGNYPLALYFVGTGSQNSDQQLQDMDLTYAGQAPQDVTQALAQRGFYALSVQYDNSVKTLQASDKDPLWSCLFGASGSLLSQLCSGAMSGVDCSKGIVTWGHSLGGATALSASHYDSRVRATWATGVNSLFMSTLDSHKIRIVNGGADGNNQMGANNNAATLVSILDLDPSSDCPGQTDQCLRDDGNGGGYIIVRGNELNPVRWADHCWFDKLSCWYSSERVEPNFASSDPSIRISIASNANWLAAAAQ